MSVHVTLTNQFKSFCLLAQKKFDVVNGRILLQDYAGIPLLTLKRLQGPLPFLLPSLSLPAQIFIVQVAFCSLPCVPVHRGEGKTKQRAQSAAAAACRSISHNCPSALFSSCCLVGLDRLMIPPKSVSQSKITAVRLGLLVWALTPQAS